MIDLHSHILPAVTGDDGSKSMEMTLSMLRMAVEAGVTEIVATPHVNRHDVIPSWEEITTKVREVQQEAQKAGIPIKIHQGAEVAMNARMLEHLPKDGKEYCLAGTNYILSELDEQSDPDLTERLLYDLMLRGYQPILAHPERYDRIMHHPERVLEWMQRGVLTQCNIGSFNGDFKEMAKTQVRALAKNHMIVFLGSDAHRDGWRNPDTRKAQQALIDFMGDDELIQQATANAAAIFQGKVLYPNLPDHWQKPKKKGFFARLFGK